jgi:hypothetical protein
VNFLDSSSLYEVSLVWVYPISLREGYFSRWVSRCTETDSRGLNSGLYRLVLVHALVLRLRPDASYRIDPLSVCISFPLSLTIIHIIHESTYFVKYFK